MSYRSSKRPRSDSYERRPHHHYNESNYSRDDKYYGRRNDRRKDCYQNRGKYSSRDGRTSYDSRSKSPSYSGSSSFDDEIGHYVGEVGDSIEGRYTIDELLGKGTFGKVFKCFDSKHKENVAIKVVRNIKKYIDSAKIEAKYLSDIYDKQLEKGSNYCVKMYSHFYWNSYYIMVFERLGVSLYDLVKKNNYKRFPLSVVKHISKQILLAMEFLQSINIIHTDLKLENIMFVHNTMSTSQVEHRGEYFTIEIPQNTRIKVIDFGGATYDNDEDKSSVINTRQYRSPEVMLQSPQWSFPSDLWSVGCIIGEIYQGELFFQTHEELEHLALIEKLCGKFPSYMIDRADNASKYFDRDNHVRLDKLPRDSKKFVRQFPATFEEIFSLSAKDKDSGIVELVHDLLTIDPKQRITATQALTYRFLQDT